MARSLVLGNSSMLIGLDERSQVRELYFPFVGQENHVTSQSIHRIGVWVSGKFRWFSDPSWNHVVDCMEDALAGDSTHENTELGVRIHLTDVVYNEKNIFVRKITVDNLTDNNLHVKVYFGHEFELYESTRGDTAYYDPRNRVLVHYKGRRVFLANATASGEQFTEYTTGVFDSEGKEGSYRDAEDGDLSRNPIEHGRADSVLGVSLHVASTESQVAYYWMCAAESLSIAQSLNAYTLARTPQHIIDSTVNYWNAWIHRYDFQFEGLSDDVVKLFKKSLLYIRAHVDRHGSIIASGDTTMLNGGKDTYSYMWPRDGAFIAMAMSRSGLSNASQRFFEFCSRVVTDDGFFMHKYLPDESLGSSWHPWIRDGVTALPIQEDETALVILALRDYYKYTHNLEFIESLYNPLIKRCADFMVRYSDEATGLPKPSYDLWEEKYGIHTFTVAAVCAALEAAAEISDILGKTKNARTYREAKAEYLDALMKYLYDPEKQTFIKMVYIHPDGTMQRDETTDMSSVYAMYAFGILNPDDELLKTAFAKMAPKLKNPTGVSGYVRYEGDEYFRIDPSLPGNPWFITTLWYAQYLAATATSYEELDPVKEWLAWAVQHAQHSGVMSEQLNPHTGEPLSAGPLVWSHAEYLKTVFAYLDALKRLGICTTCNPIH